MYLWHAYDFGFRIFAIPVCRVEWLERVWGVRWLERVRGAVLTRGLGNVALGNGHIQGLLQESIHAYFKCIFTCYMCQWLCPLFPFWCHRLESVVLNVEILQTDVRKGQKKCGCVPFSRTFCTSVVVGVLLQKDQRAWTKRLGLTGYFMLLLCL